MVPSLVASVLLAACGAQNAVPAIPTVEEPTGDAHDEVVTFNTLDSQLGSGDVSVTVRITNRDVAAHTLTRIQANFYDASFDSLGDDPLVHVVAVGRAQERLALSAGESRTVTITARNTARRQVYSVGFGPTLGS